MRNWSDPAPDRRIDGRASEYQVPSVPDRSLQFATRTSLAGRSSLFLITAGLAFLSAQLAGLGNHLDLGHGDFFIAARGTCTGLRLAHLGSAAARNRAMNHNFVTHVCGEVFRSVQGVGVSLCVLQRVLAAFGTDASLYLMFAFRFALCLSFGAHCCALRPRSRAWLLGRRGALLPSCGTLGSSRTL